MKEGRRELTSISGRTETKKRWKEGRKEEGKKRRKKEGKNEEGKNT
jgi:hypothetical protein